MPQTFKHRLPRKNHIRVNHGESVVDLSCLLYAFKALHFQSKLTRVNCWHYANNYDNNNMHICLMGAASVEMSCFNAIFTLKCIFFWKKVASQGHSWSNQRPHINLLSFMQMCFWRILLFLSISQRLGIEGKVMCIDSVHMHFYGQTPWTHFVSLLPSTHHTLLPWHNMARLPGLISYRYYQVRIHTLLPRHNMARRPDSPD